MTTLPADLATNDGASGCDALNVNACTYSTVDDADDGVVAGGLIFVGAIVALASIIAIVSVVTWAGNGGKGKLLPRLM